MKSDVYLNEKDLDKLKKEFRVKDHNLNIQKTTSPGLIKVEAPGIMITVDGVERLSRAGVSFSGIRKSYDEERMFASDGKVWTMVRSMDSQPVAPVGRDGKVCPSERDAIIFFWKIMDNAHKNLGIL